MDEEMDIFSGTQVFAFALMLRANRLSYFDGQIQSISNRRGLCG
jgi:hypothetical protein